jgi:hypothetical protein
VPKWRPFGPSAAVVAGWVGLPVHVDKGHMSRRTKRVPMVDGIARAAQFARQFNFKVEPLIRMVLIEMVKSPTRRVDFFHCCTQHVSRGVHDLHAFK